MTFGLGLFNEAYAMAILGVVKAHHSRATDNCEYSNIQSESRARAIMLTATVSFIIELACE